MAAIGECMIELTGSGDKVHAGFAGDTLNTAVNLARLLPAATGTVSYISALGDDPFSADMRAAWTAEGIDTALVASVSGALPGLYWVVNDDKGERAFHYWRRESAARQLLRQFDDPAAVLSGFDLLYLSGITLAILEPADRARLLDALVQCRATGTRIAFDPNYRPRLWRDAADARAAFERAFACCDIALTGREEAAAVFGDQEPRAISERLRAVGAKEVVITDAAAPTWLADADGLASLAPPPARVVDTTGAGDAFNAAYLATRTQGGTMAEAAAAGHALAAAVIGWRGAILPRERMPALRAAS